jgi:16S rRNA (cytidine1402-2'-O)-methyltransferase
LSDRVGALVLVGTPIGNLSDLSPRAVEALRGADVIACEDTRRTRKLLSHAGITGSRLVTVNDVNERARSQSVLRLLEAGDTVALVSDAGMPGLSDPGEDLVAAAVAAGFMVQVVPGPSAAVSALVVSGLSTGRFCFEGFLPRKGSGRRERLESLASEERTLVLYEAPHRVRQTVEELASACGGDRRVVMARELTKMFEETWRGTLEGLGARLAEVEPRGEIVLVIEGAPPAPPASPDDVEGALRARLSAGLDKKTAVAEVARELSVAKRLVYEVATRL